MSNNTLFHKFQVEGLLEHLENFFHKQVELAENAVRETDEWENKKQEYLTTQSYENLIKNIDENAPTKFADYIKYIVESLFNIDNNIDFKYFIQSAIEDAWFVKNRLGINGISIYPSSRTIDFTTDNYYKKIVKLVDKAIDKTIEEEQGFYANTQLLKWNPVKKEDMDKLQALLLTAPVCSTADLEQMILNNFDFDKIVRK